MEHIRSIDPNEAWKEGFSFFLRVRGLLLCAGADLGLTVLSHFLINWQTALLVLVVGGVAVFTLFIFRSIRIRDLWLGVYLHSLFHRVRDRAAEVVNAFTEESNFDLAIARYRERYRHIHDLIADQIAAYFRCLLKDSSVNCAIRLAEEQNGDRLYVTKGRSSGMDPTRGERSQPIRSDQGIAAAMMRQEERGVYFVPDVRNISEEDKRDKWTEDLNCRLHDVTALMVAPINAWDGGKKFMLGLLYITSRRGRINYLCIEPLKAVADALGHMYPKITVQPRMPSGAIGQGGQDAHDTGEKPSDSAG